MGETEEMMKVLIELKTKTELWHEEVTKTITNHIKDDAVAQDRLERIVNAAHKRLDGFGSIKDKILGGAAVIGLLYGTMMAILPYLHHTPKGG